MGKEKSPAYQWYPKDILTDKRVLCMSNETENMYRRLLDHAWLENGLDNNLSLLAAFAKLPGQVEKFKEHWKEIKKCFVFDGKKWRSPRQEKERKKQKKFSDKQRKASKARWNKEVTNHATDMPRHQSGKAFHLQSSFPSSIKDRSDAFCEFDEKQMHELKAVISQIMGHGIMSEATEENTRHVLSQVKKAHKRTPIENRFAYALTVARNLKNGKNNFNLITQN